MRQLWDFYVGVVQKRRIAHLYVVDSIMVTVGPL